MNAETHALQSSPSKSLRNCPSISFSTRAEVYVETPYRRSMHCTVSLDFLVEAARYAPSPIDNEPANSSARPAVTTSLDEPILERPAVNAKGTVRPSANPIVKSRRQAW